MLRLKHRDLWGGARDLWLGLRSARYWRPASLLMLAVIAGALLALPSAGASDAHRGTTTSAARLSLNVVVVGDFFSDGYASSTDPALRLSVPPTLAALNQVQAANRDVQLHVLFIPVSEATWNSLYKGGGTGKPPLINSVKDANLVIVGVGADVPGFARSLRTILFGTRVSAAMYPPLMRIFGNGSYQQEETAFLEDIAAREAPGGVIVTLGYPLVQQQRLPSGRVWWSALSWSTISGRQARLANRLVSALDSANAAATKAAGTQYQQMHLLYADPSAMPGEASARGSQATAMKETLIANTLLPYVAQAVNDELTSRGVPGSPDIPAVTPASRWELSVQFPTGAPAPLPSRSAPARQGLTNTQASPGNSPSRPVVIHVPMIPAPAAPIPKPIAPLVPPNAVGTGGAPAGGTNPGAAGASPGGSTPGSGTTSPGGTTSPSAGGTTSTGTTSPGGTTSPSAGGTTSSPSFGATSSGGGTSFGGGSVS